MLDVRCSINYYTAYITFTTATTTTTTVYTTTLNTLTTTNTTLSLGGFICTSLLLQVPF